MAQKLLKKKSKQQNKNSNKTDKPKHKIKKNKPQTLYNKMVTEENTKITKTINKNIEEQMMAKARLNQESFKLLKTKEEQKKIAKEAKKQA
ncbi:unnamed protein product (macronuclear) [Paramecium tetraurelia]|uniref:Uncharacterized protein n=1 Tax=Paramecium tetraurelia TaxID=5888 RepID=A0DZF9_PARTE|nr:uncharacterized protein GSPATT00021593001 [Paramecium tetraurelia]CAK88426.1 unnamed protein product [Paramecium tetraurelia]|eukprot:XP_001455823.1 hypothetical protein (macronuclear) [Paramecium tetraurelia strain d4-2]